MIEYTLDVFLIILLFGLYGFIHSFFASDKAKEILLEKFGNLIAFYRLFYNISSLVIFYLIFDLMPRPRPVLYDLPRPYDIAILIPQFLSLLGILWSFRYFSLNEFLGIDQVFRYFNNSYDKSELDEHLTLKIEGPFKFCRHPIYFFSILFLAFRPEMDLFYLTSLICIIAYFYIGSVYEERKLVKRFGKIYIDYQKSTPRILPVSLKRHHNN